MEAAKKRILTRRRNKAHIRKRISGTAERPRVSVFRSAKHIYAQAIDDEKGMVLASASSLMKDIKKQINGFKIGNNLHFPFYIDDNDSFAFTKRVRAFLIEFDHINKTVKKFLPNKK